MIRALHMLATCAIGLAAAAPALAAPQSSDVVRSRVVRLSDLNLSSPAGAETALRRISTAARVVCDTSSSTRDSVALRRDRNCRRETLNSAINRLAAPQVTIAYVRKTHQAAETRTASR